MTTRSAVLIGLILAGATALPVLAQAPPPPPGGRAPPTPDALGPMGGVPWAFYVGMALRRLRSRAN